MTFARMNALMCAVLEKRMQLSPSPGLRYPIGQLLVYSLCAKKTQLSLTAYCIRTIVAYTAQCIGYVSRAKSVLYGLTHITLYFGSTGLQYCK